MSGITASNRIFYFDTVDLFEPDTSTAELPRLNVVFNMYSQKSQFSLPNVYRSVSDANGADYLGETKLPTSLGSMTYRKTGACHEAADGPATWQMLALPQAQDGSRNITLDHAVPLQDWELPEEFATLCRLMEGRMAKHGRREYVQVLRLDASIYPDFIR